MRRSVNTSTLKPTAKSSGGRVDDRARGVRHAVEEVGVVVALNERLAHHHGDERRRRADARRWPRR